MELNYTILVARSVLRIFNVQYDQWVADVILLESVVDIHTIQNLGKKMVITYRPFGLTNAVFKLDQNAFQTIIWLWKCIDLKWFGIVPNSIIWFGHVLIHAEMILVKINVSFQVFNSVFNKHTSLYLDFITSGFLKVCTGAGTSQGLVIVAKYIIQPGKISLETSNSSIK